MTNKSVFVFKSDISGLLTHHEPLLFLKPWVDKHTSMFLLNRCTRGFVCVCVKGHGECLVKIYQAQANVKCCFPARLSGPLGL